MYNWIGFLEKKGILICQPVHNFSKMIAKETANKQYQYDDIVRGKSLHDWATEVNSRLCTLNEWKVSPLKKGSFGYDTIIVSIGNAFQETDTMEIIRKSDLADKVHQGWAANYLYWRDHCPYENENGLYIKPSNPFGDVHRDLCALQSYSEVSIDVREKADLIAGILLNLLVEELIV